MMLSMSDTSANNPGCAACAGCARTYPDVIVSLQQAGNVRLATWFLQRPGSIHECALALAGEFLVFDAVS
jgi:hypothetical protein